MLTASGSLPPHDENLARTEQWLRELLTGIEPPEDTRLVQAYATWQVMRRPRASAKQNRARTPTANARNNIRAAAASLLAWLRSRHTTRASAGKATSTSGCAPGRQPAWRETS